MTQSEKSQFLLLFRTPADQKEPSPEEMQQIFGRWMAWMKEMKAAGQYVGGDRLDETGKVLRGKRGASVTDGPFAESKELLGGYIIILASNLEEAVEIAKGCPGYDYGTCTEVRRIEKLPAI